MRLKIALMRASTNEISNLEEVLDTADLPENIPLKAYKGYQSKKNTELLKQRKLKSLSVLFSVFPYYFNRRFYLLTIPVSSNKYCGPASISMVV